MAAAVGLLVVAALSDCAAVAAGGHIRDAAEAASTLAHALKDSPGVRSAGARYNVVDKNGELVFVRVAMAPDASGAQWSAVEQVIDRALRGTDLRVVRQHVRITAGGASPATVEYPTSSEWSGRASLADEARTWIALRDASDVPITMAVDPANGRRATFRISSEADSRRFVQRSKAFGDILAGQSVTGYGFTGFGPAPAGLDRVYRRVLATHPGADERTIATQPLPVALLTWWANAWDVMVIAPTTTPAPTTADIALAAALQERRTSGTAGQFRWQTNGSIASVVFGRCARGHLHTEATDRQLAAAVTRAAHGAASGTRPGTCL